MTQSHCQPGNDLYRVAAVHFQALAGNIRLPDHLCKLTSSAKAEYTWPPPVRVKARCQHCQRTLCATNIKIGDHEGDGHRLRWPRLSGLSRDSEPMTKVLPYQKRHIVFSEGLLTCFEAGSTGAVTKSLLNPLRGENCKAVNDFISSSVT